MRRQWNLISTTQRRLIFRWCTEFIILWFRSTIYDNKLKHSIYPNVPVPDELEACIRDSINYKDLKKYQNRIAVKLLIKNIAKTWSKQKVVAQFKSQLWRSADKIKPFHKSKILINIDRAFEVSKNTNNFRKEIKYLRWSGIKDSLQRKYMRI